ncbi:MAG: DUF4214 domain-containing protein, partial [Betaproteobacteria bacterium]|nr:DUF4214 domain-containing protein [Betaproteobacteria bacterium]
MAITNAMRTDVANFYVAMFGRAPDAEGLLYWATRLEQGESLISLANAMYAVDPARVFYPVGASPTQIITSFYNNVLGRAPDSTGLAFWVGKLSQLNATPGSVILEMINVVENFQGSPDPVLHKAGIQSRDLFLNRAEVALYYGQKGGGITDAFRVLQGVTSDAATVATAKANAD